MKKHTSKKNKNRLLIIHLIATSFINLKPPLVNKLNRSLKAEPDYT